MLVKVLQDGRFLDKHLKAFSAQAGEIVDVLNEDYAKDLVRSGIAEYVVADNSPTPPAEEEEPVGGGAPIENDPIAALTAVKGIGKALAEKLVAGGITNVDALVTTDAGILAEALGLSVKQIERLQAAGRQLAETEE